MSQVGQFTQFVALRPVDTLYGMVYHPTCTKLNISYSEWWRYIGPVKPRQPLPESGKRCLPER